MNALNTSLIISYSRPFTRNDGQSSAIPSLPSRTLKYYNKKEAELHNKILKLRNRAFAHSDADLFDVNLTLHREYLIPFFQEYPLEYFSKEELIQFEEMVEKLFRVFAEFIESIFEHYGDDAVNHFTK